MPIRKENWRLLTGDWGNKRLRECNSWRPLRQNGSGSCRRLRSRRGNSTKYPLALDEKNYLVSYSPEAAPNRRYARPLAIYWVSIDGRKELLAYDPTLACHQIVPLAAREKAFERAATVNHRAATGTYLVQDVYAGPGLAGVPRGTVKRLRVVALEYRPANVGYIPCGGPGGTSNQHGPVAVGNGTYDVKKVLGTVDVEEDGSALFKVPARTPVYFQTLDERGHVVQSMRSWSTLQPGEYFGCVGCHENKASTPRPEPDSERAMARPAQVYPAVLRTGAWVQLPQRNPTRFGTRHCIGCHRLSPGEKAAPGEKDVAFSLLSKPVPGGKIGADVGRIVPAAHQG